MSEVTKKREFSVLGFNVRFKAPHAGDELGSIDAQIIVNTVEKMADDILKANSKLDKGKLAVLVALQLAAEKLSLEGEYRQNVESLRDVASSALNLIEEVIPEDR